MAYLADTEVGRIVVDHHRSLPYLQREGHDASPLPWVATFYVAPAIATGALGFAELAAPRSVSVGLLAGVGVLGGLLFQVLAWVSGRIGVIADSTSPDAPGAHEIKLLTRLDIARTNIAYASLISLVLVVELGVMSLLKAPPTWTTWVAVFLLLHFVATLVLMLTRINSIGRTDRVAALTRHAREQPKI